MFVIALIAIIFSTILGIVKIYEFINDRYNAKVVVTDIKTSKIGLTTTKIEDYIYIFVTNIGKNPVTIIRVGLLSAKLKDREGYCFKRSLDRPPKVRLLASDSEEYMVRKSKVEKSIDIGNKKYVAYALDSAGRKYYSHNFIKRLLRIKRIK